MPPEVPSETFWTEVTGENLAQGDLLPDCLVPVFPADYAQTEVSPAVQVRKLDLIVMTQSCDLENHKVNLVAMCPIMTIDQLTIQDHKYGKPDRLDEIRKGKFEALHMLSSTYTLSDRWGVRIVDFREIHSLPVQFLSSHALKLGKRWRLKSPISSTFHRLLHAFSCALVCLPRYPSSSKAFARDKHD
jgi:hypothetical protein